ncbi:hypothetical protein KAR48_13545 [bacterium]|nr:hypothetical protein [bacterium]
MDKIQSTITNLVTKVYQTSSYPTAEMIITDEVMIRNIVSGINEKSRYIAEYKKCSDCFYCYQIAISVDLPIIPNAHEKERMRDWIKKYGQNYWQMYIAISKLGKLAFYYWTKYGLTLFKFKTVKHNYYPPNNDYKKVQSLIDSILSNFDIEVLEAKLVTEEYKVKYDGKIIGYDPKPNLVKLLFTEELH